MKKIRLFKILLYIGFALLSFVPRAATYADTTTPCVDDLTATPPKFCATGTYVTPKPGCAGLDSLSAVAGLFPHYCTANDLLVRVVNFLFVILGLIAVLFIIFGGYQYLTSAGNATKAKAGTETLKYALLGLVVIILAYSIVGIITNSAVKGLGGTTTGSSTSSGGNGDGTGTGTGTGTDPGSTGNRNGTTGSEGDTSATIAPVRTAIDNGTEGGAPYFKYNDGQTIRITVNTTNSQYTNCNSNSEPPCTITVTVTRQPENIAGNNSPIVFPPVTISGDGQAYTVSTGSNPAFKPIGDFNGTIDYNVKIVYTSSDGKVVSKGETSFQISYGSGPGN